MPSLEWIPWMPSPPLVPESAAQGCLSDDTVINLDHLMRMTLGEDALRREVLGLFDQRATAVMDQLNTSQSGVAELVHSLKGAASAIGASAVVEAAERVERVLKDDTRINEAIAALDSAVSKTRLTIARMLQSS